MRIKILQTTSIPGLPELQKDSVADIDTCFAQELMARGQAMPVATEKEERPKKAETSKSKN